ncbi:MFS transporter [Bradyrhizobium pachyrhizi]|uniref:MFS transporter n=1 Tax=Bradyrhizobium pachyrhizi TaxID=280333 RepID=UPI003D3647F9
MRETAEVLGRLDAIDSTPRLWYLVFLLAVGGFFEHYDWGLTAPISAGLVADGVFRVGNAGLFGFPDQATFVFATFAGLFIGILGYGLIGDRLGRKFVFCYALLLYAGATLVMGLQHDALWTCFWRFIAGIGVGAENVAIDCYLIELLPKRLRGRAFSLTMTIMFCGGPVGAFLGLALVPDGLLGIAGWRWLAFVPVLGAMGFWWFRLALPESPTWLAQQGHLQEAHQVLDRLGAPLQSATHQRSLDERSASTPNMSVAKLAGMLLVYTNFLVIAYFGFVNWLPAFLQAHGVPLKQSLAYNAGITAAVPVGCLIFIVWSDLGERKFLLVGNGVAAVIFGLCFGWASAPAGWLLFGVCLQLTLSAQSVLTHNYVAEVFPSKIRARAVGLIWSTTRISAAVSGYIVVWVLDRFGVSGVLAMLSGLMFVGLFGVLVFGPRTRTSAVTYMPEQFEPSPHDLIVVSQSTAGGE